MVYAKTPARVNLFVCLSECDPTTAYYLIQPCKLNRFGHLVAFVIYKCTLKRFLFVAL